jgi:hypothetical protein
MRRSSPPSAATSPWAVDIVPTASSRRAPAPANAMATPADASSAPSALAPVAAPPTAAPLPTYAPPAAAYPPPAVFAPPAAPIAPATSAAPTGATVPAPGYGPVDRFGLPVTPTSPAFGMQPAGSPPMSSSYPPPTGYGPPVGYLPPVAQQGWPTAAKVAIGAVAGVIAVAILAAVAIPVFLNQRLTPANRPVAIPQTILGMGQLDDPALAPSTQAALTAMNPEGYPWGSATGAYFGQDGSPEFFVAAAKLTRQLTIAERDGFFRGAGDKAALQKVGSGPFGGAMECASLSSGSAQGVECISIDSAAIVTTTVINAVEGGPTIGGAAL